MGGDPLCGLSYLRTEAPTAKQRCDAVLVVAGQAKDAADLIDLLQMLGLSPSDARPSSIESVKTVAPVYAAGFLAELAALLAESRRQTACTSRHPGRTGAEGR
ncbi:MAG TPA: hypothetical protein VFX16_37745 [Pseudonocardiaceae bacterium]|nr:hypothetical protein [Pseudonocardiaceae bacterium]